MSEFDDPDDHARRGRLAQPQDSTSQEEARREEAFYHYFQKGVRVTWLTSGLIFANAAVFGAMVVQGVSPFLPGDGAIIRWGGNFAPLTTTGEPWRLFTAMFLHVGAIHLFVNMYALWQLGRFVERLVGHWGFLILYLISGLGASLTSTIWHPHTVSAGASGALFGIFGTIIAFLIKQGSEIPPFIRRSMMHSAVLNLGVNLAIGIGVPFIDMSGHMGGLVVGFALGYVLTGPLTAAGRTAQWRRNITAGVAGIAGVAGTFLTMPPVGDARMIADWHSHPGTYDERLLELERLSRTDPKNPTPHLAKASLLAGAGRLDEARAELDRAIAKADKQSELLELYRARGLIRSEMGEWAAAAGDFGRAISLEHPLGRMNLLNQRGFAWYMLGDDKAAEADWLAAADLVPSFGLDRKALANARAGNLENIGLIYLRNSQWEDAMKWSASVNALDSGMAWNWLFRAIAADKLGRKNEAAGALAKWTEHRVTGSVGQLRIYLPEPLHEYLDRTAGTNGKDDGRPKEPAFAPAAP